MITVLRRLGALLVVLYPLATPAAVLTFSDQPAGDGPMLPSVYGSAQGLQSGLTATFSNFNHYDGDPDHTPVSGDDKLLYGAGAAASVSFSGPVQVPSLWVSTGPFGSTSATIVGSLQGLPVFTFTNGATPDTFHEVTVGAGQWIDRLTFNNFADSELDDVSVVPEPGVLAMALTCLLTVSRRRCHSRSAERQTS